MKNDKQPRLCTKFTHNNLPYDFQINVHDFDNISSFNFTEIVVILHLSVFLFQQYARHAGWGYASDGAETS